MRLHVTFGEMIDDLKAELGQSLSQAAGTSQLPKLKRAINAEYLNLYGESEWPHLRTTFDRKPLQAGERYYDPPLGLDVERIEDVIAYWNGSPYPIYRGIGAPQYASNDSVEDERSDPPLRYAIRYTDKPLAATMIEIWPVPATNEASLEFVGTRQVKPLVEHTDVCLLDAESVILYAKAALADAEEFERALGRARARFNRVKGRKPAAPRVRIGMGTGEDELLSGKAVVRVSRGSTNKGP